MAWIRYKVEKHQVYSNGQWIDIEPLETRLSDPLGEYNTLEECYRGKIPQYQWVDNPELEPICDECYEPMYRTITGTPYCNGYSKYAVTYYQISENGGNTWETTATSENMIERLSPDCGYTPPTPPPTGACFTIVPIDNDMIVRFVGHYYGETDHFKLYWSYDGGNTWETWDIQYTDCMEAWWLEIKLGKTLTISADTCNDSESLGYISVFDYIGGECDFGRTGRFYIQGDLSCINVGSDNYRGMFAGNTNLISAEHLILPAPTKANQYQGLFSGCTSLERGPELSGDVLTEGCYSYMFSGCTSLNYIKCLATDISASGCTTGWVDGVSPTGTFIRHCNNFDWTRGTSGIPSNWTVNCEGIAYRWNKAPITEYECVGTDKHYVEYYQYSNDGGNTWHNVEPVSSRTSPDVIEYESEDCGYDYSVFSGMYLTFEAIDDATFSITRAGGGSGIIKYSLDSGTTWTTYSSGVLVNAGNQIWWSGNTTSSGGTTFQRGIGTFNSTGRFKAYGNATTILNNRSTAAANSRLGYLFKDNTYLVSAGGLYLVPSGQPYSIYHNQYVSMFEGCSRLIKAPKLPFINLGQCCYLRMFKGCTSLETAPSLPAIDIPPIAYHSMFAGCTSLKTIPTFSVGLAAGYEALQYMFSGCTSLVDASTVILNATTEYDYCYNAMFSGCTALETAPTLTFNNPQKFTGEIYNVFQRTYNWQCMGMFYGCTNLKNISNINLRATSLKERCYYFMFYGCSSITTAPALPATTLDEGCYQYMFSGCTSLETAPDLNVLTLVDSCYTAMFLGCSSLNYIKCLATNISAYSCTGSWLSGVSPTGTFVKNSSMSSWPSGGSGIPDGWTIQNA